MTKTVLETLEAARSWLSDESRWTKHKYFANEDGSSLLPRQEEATAQRTCATGALCMAAGTRVEDTEGSEAWKALLDAMDVEEVSTYNDTHTHAEVLAAFDAAIAKEKAGAA